MVRPQPQNHFRKLRLAAVGLTFWLLLLSLWGLPLRAQAVVQPGQDAVLSFGGRLYDNHWTILNRQPPTSRHPLFPKQVKIAPGATWRCVSCHGWDYRGAEGHLGKASKDPAFSNLAGMTGQDPQSIVESLVSETHRPITAPLSQEQLLALAKFLSFGQHDMSEFSGAEGRAVGNPLRGEDIFEGTCQRCHGADGKAPIYGEEGDKPSLGWLARNRTEQAVHKIRNGVPQADMLSLRFLDPKSMSGLLAYLQTLDQSQ
jgi:mono/diheme cytochrome c family protein